MNELDQKIKSLTPKSDSDKEKIDVLLKTYKVCFPLLSFLTRPIREVLILVA
jgi:hypothetical protein